MSEKSLEKTQAKFSKKDFLVMYGNVKIEVFEEWIEKIKQEIGWKPKKKQLFPPKAARLIIEHIGQPIKLRVLNQ